jgi:hypothetical protein
MGQRAVAQLGSALDWGSRGRRFKSCQPDGHASEGPNGSGRGARWFSPMIHCADGGVQQGLVAVGARAVGGGDPVDGIQLNGRGGSSPALALRALSP